MIASDSSEQGHGWRIVALVLSLVFNAALIFAVFQVRFQALPVSEAAVEIVFERPPPPPLPVPPEEKMPVPKVSSRFTGAASQRMAKPEQTIQAPVEPGPPVHFLDPSGEVAADPSAIGGGKKGTGARRESDRHGMHAPSDYADKVKSRIIAAMSYPAEAKKNLQECFVSYTVSVDSNGNMLSYDIDKCGNDLLDQAVRNAILQAAPFPVPPNLGAERYAIQGSLVFRLK